MDPGLALCSTCVRVNILFLEKKISRLCNCIDSAFPSSHICARVLASIVVQIISMSLAIGPVARLRTRIL